MSIDLKRLLIYYFNNKLAKFKKITYNLKIHRKIQNEN